MGGKFNGSLSINVLINFYIGEHFLFIFFLLVYTVIFNLSSHGHPLTPQLIKFGRYYVFRILIPDENSHFQVVIIHHYDHFIGPNHVIHTTKDYYSGFYIVQN